MYLTMSFAKKVIKTEGKDGIDRIKGLEKWCTRA